MGGREVHRHVEKKKWATFFGRYINLLKKGEKPLLTRRNIRRVDPVKVGEGRIASGGKSLINSRLKP